MTATKKTEHAVVIDRGLLCVVSCRPLHQIVVLSPRADEEGYPHATYHVDGPRQLRSRLGTGKRSGPGGKYLVQSGWPRLDAPISTPVNVFALTVRSEDTRWAKPYEKGRHSSIVQIPAAAFDRGPVIVSVDIVEPGLATPAQFGHECFKEADLPGTTPPVRVTIWTLSGHSVTPIGSELSPQSSRSCGRPPCGSWSSPPGSPRSGGPYRDAVATTRGGITVAR
jgi:hypothetical protein